MFKAAIWANKNSDDTFTLWAVNAPNYEIETDLNKGIQRLMNYGANKIGAGEGIFLCSIKDVSKEFRMGTLDSDGSIVWSKLYDANPEEYLIEEEKETTEQLERFAKDDLFLLVTENQTGAVIYTRQLKDDDLLDLDSYLPEIEQATELKINPQRMFPSRGQIGVTIGYSANPENDTCVWDTKDYNLA